VETGGGSFRMDEDGRDAAQDAPSRRLQSRTGFYLLRPLPTTWFGCGVCCPQQFIRITPGRSVPGWRRPGHSGTLGSAETRKNPKDMPRISRDLRSAAAEGGLSPAPASQFEGLPSSHICLRKNEQPAAMLRFAHDAIRRRTSKPVDSAVPD
jgi:hypothetical protein